MVHSSGVTVAVAAINDIVIFVAATATTEETRIAAMHSTYPSLTACHNLTEATLIIALSCC
jgi:hypothetical protein